MRKLIFIVLILPLLLFSCAKKNSVVLEKEITEEVLPLGAIENEFVILLKGKVSPKALVGAFKNNNLEIIKPVSRNSNMWLFKYEQKTKNPLEMYNLLKNSEYVQSVEFNKKIKGRK